MRCTSLKIPQRSSGGFLLKVPLSPGLLLFGLSAFSCGPSDEERPPKVGVEALVGPVPVKEVIYFFSPGCPDCAVVEETVLPRLLRVPGMDGLRKVNVDEKEGRELLFSCEKRLDFRTKWLAPVLIVGHRAYLEVNEMLEFAEEAGDAGSL